jgi:hypothetical protein
VTGEASYLVSRRFEQATETLEAAEIPAKILRDTLMIDFLIVSDFWICDGVVVGWLG